MEKEQAPKTIIKISLDADDSILDIVSKIKQAKGNRLIVQVPYSFTLLENPINLRLLAKKLADSIGQVAIHSANPKVLRNAQEVGFKTIVVKTKATASVPVATSSRVGKLLFPEKPNNSNLIYFGLVNKRPLLFFALISLVFLMLIVYLAIPGATLYLKPTTQIKTSALNVVLVDVTKETVPAEHPYLVPAYPLQIIFEKEVTMSVSGENFLGASSQGKIVLTNARKDPWTIVKNSRLQTQTGLVFLTQKQVVVPPARLKDGKIESGKLEVEVVAREKDALGQIIGAKGNVEPTIFFFPALSAENQRLIWGESQVAFTGGTTQTEKFVLETDKQNALKKIEQEMKFQAVNELKKAVEKLNQERKARFVLFDKFNDCVRSKLLSTDVDKIVPGTKQENFTVKGAMEVFGYFFDDQYLVEILARNLREHLAPTEILHRVKNDSLTYNELLKVDLDKGYLKFTSSLRGVISFRFQNEKKDLTKIVQDKVKGMPIQTAENWVNNLREVSSVRIKTWPWWSPNLPALPGNIKVVIEEVE
ncbi:hypothetical protein AUJ78_00630 [Candidatus Peregrinibacteria bacterium CG1_02_41_10]|nr:MAG: hypothetical protein AUJ78_00630 [Candidatus Peregrinibacteria bacterium CG1_02_41_10]